MFVKSIGFYTIFRYGYLYGFDCSDALYGIS